MVQNSSRDFRGRFAALKKFVGACAALLATSAAFAGPLDTLPAGRWYAFPSSRMDAVAPTSGVSGEVKSVMSAWSGGVYDTDRDQLVVWGGGHIDYAGNEVYAFGPLSSATPAWKRLTNPTIPAANNVPRGSDGRPVPRHTYNLLDYMPAPYNKMASCAIGAQYSNGYSGGSVDFYDFRVNGLTGQPWSAGPTAPSNSYAVEAFCAYNPVTQRLWYNDTHSGSARLQEYNPATNTWTSHATFNPDVAVTPAIDTKRNLLVAAGGGKVIVYKLGAPDSAPIIATTSGSSPVQNGHFPGFVYDTSNDRFVGWDGGSQVYVLSIPSTAPSGTWAWSTIQLDSGNSVTPTAIAGVKQQGYETGTFGRFRYVPSQQGVVLVNATDESVFFFKLAGAKTGGGGSQPAPPATPLPTVTLTASPTTVAAQSSTALTWSSTNAASCTASGGWSGAKATSGTASSGPISINTSYTLTCVNADGASASATAAVAVAVSNGGGASGPLTLTLNASPESVASKGTTAVTWTSTGATSCTASNAWSGAKSTSGTEISVPLTAKSLFSLSCTGPSGSIKRNFSVSIGSAAAAPTLTFSASPVSVTSGANSKLTWSTTNATTCTASGGWSGTKATSGTATVGPLTSSATYSLSCSGAGGAVQKSAQVTVVGATDPTPPVTPTPPVDPTPPVTTPTGAVTSVVIQNTSGSALTQVPVTFGEVFKRGDIASASSLKASLTNGTALPVQVDAKSLYPDGSVRNAVLSLRLPSAAASGATQIQIGNGSGAATGSAVALSQLLATSFDAQLGLTIGGQKYTASARNLLQGGGTVTQWLSGPLVSEWIVGGPVRTSAGAAHPHLTAYFHVRAYRNGSTVDRVRVDTVIENGWTLVPGPATFSYTADINVGGQSVYSKAVSQYHHTRWHKQFWWPSAPSVVVKHDTTYLQATRAIPGYMAVKPTESYLSGLVQEATPMGIANLSPYFPDTGAQDQIGPMPRWAATYVTSGADPRAFRNLLANDDSAGSYSVHYRDEGTGAPVSIVDRPTLTLQNSSLPAVSGSNPNTEDNAHQPSIGFLSYLVTGDYFYLEEMQFWTSWNLLWQSAEYRQGAKGIFTSQVRTQAWSLRNLAQSAFATPDSSPLKAKYASNVNSNIANYASLYSNNPNGNKLGAVKSYDGYQNFAPWMDDFLSWTLAYVVDLGFDGASVRDWKLKFPVGRMGTTDYCYKNASAYHLTTGTSDDSFFPDFAALYKANFGANSSCPEGQAMAGYPDSPSGYPSNLRPALVAAVEAKTPGAADAWRRFTTSAVQADYSNYAVWALLPRTGSTTTPPANAPTLTFNLSSLAVTPGSQVTLTWSAVGATTCSASQGWSGTKATAGTETVGPFSADTTFGLSCTGSGGSVSKSLALTVKGATTPVPTVTFTATPASVVSGGQTSLQWSSTNATSCTASGGWSGTKATSGTQAITSLKASASFTLACSGAGGSATKSASVTVTAAPVLTPTATLGASPTSVKSGGSTTLSWTSKNATSCTASGGWSGTKAVAGGSQSITNITKATTFTLACSNGTTSAQASAQVSITTTTPPTNPAPTLSLTSNVASVASGGTATLNWTSANATSCTASGGWTGTKVVSGAASVGPLTKTSSFTLACTGAGGSVQSSVSIAVGGATATGGLSGAVDSSLVKTTGQNRVYVFKGSVTPHDYDGSTGDPVYTIPVNQENNACTFRYALPTLPAGTYTVAFTNQGEKDVKGQNDSLSFVGTSSVTVGATAASRNFSASNILRVGPGKTYATIRAAAAAARDGSVIEVDVGTYPDDIVVWGRNNVVVRGVGNGRAHVHGTKVIPYTSGNDLRNGKGLWVVDGNGMRVENIEFSGAKVTDENGAGIRGEGRDLTICNGYFHDNENGYLGEAYGTLTMEYSIFANNGTGDGHTHNVYVTDGGTNDESFIFRYNDSSGVRIGHLVKTRARVNQILFNRLMDETNGTSSYNIDVPNGGLTYIIGNVMQQGTKTDNTAMVAYGAEGLGAGRTQQLYLVDNTLVNDLGRGTFVTIANGTTTFRSVNNLFVGAGTLYSGVQPQSQTNLQTQSPAFVDRAGFDYRPTSQSPTRNIGTDTGTAGSTLAVPWQYLDPAGREARVAVGAPDIGAFEYAGP